MKRTFPSFRLQTLLMASDFRGEVVVVSFAPAIFELLASLRLGVEDPPREVALARADFLRLLARIFGKSMNSITV